MRPRLNDPPQWRNWARNHIAHPAAIHHPASEDELVAIVLAAAGAGRQVKVVGAGHSFSDIGVTDGDLIILDRYTRVLGIDIERRRITVQAGLSLHELNDLLDRRGLAMANLGDIDVQTVAGATSTGTHGTGAKLKGLAASIVGLRLVTGDGSMFECDADDGSELLDVVRVGLGALGVVSTVTLEVVPSFNLRVRNEPRRLEALLRDLDSLVDDNDHFEFFWVPHTEWGLTKTNNRTTEPLTPPSRIGHYANDIVFENVGLGAICRLGRRRPSLTPRLAQLSRLSSKREFIDKSYEVFATRRLVRFCEMEYAIPREACAEALVRVRRLIEDRDYKVSFPIEVRFAAADEIALSTAHGRASAYIAVHMFEGVPYEEYFRGVEAIMNEYGGRPHWGKLHFQTAETLAPRYPRWTEFQAWRRRLDPDGRFANAYTGRVLGPV